MPLAPILIFIFSPFLNLLSSFWIMIVSKRWSSIGAILFSLSLGVISYNLQAIIECDLTRYYAIMSDLGAMNFSDAFPEIVNRVDIGSYFLMYLIALTGDYNLLQLIAVSSTYAFILIPLLHVMNKNDFKWKSKAFIVVLFLSIFEFINVYSGVRNYIALSMFFFILYRDLGKGKRTPILMYFIPALFHISMAIPALLLIISKLRIRSLNRLTGTILASSGLILSSALSLISVSGIAISTGIAQKLQWYSVDYGAVLQDNEYLFRALIFALLLLTFVICKKSTKDTSVKKKTREEAVFNSITWMLVLLTVGLLPANETFFMRFSLLAELCMIWFILSNIKALSHRWLAFLIIVYTLVAIMSAQLQFYYISLLGTYEPWIDLIFKPLFLIGLPS